MGRESVPGRCPVRSLSLIPPVMLGVRCGGFETKGGELIPLSNQLSGAVGGRASSALISIDRQGVATRGLPRGELRRRVWDRGAAGAAAMPPAAAASVACCSLRWQKTRLVTRQGLMLWRDVRRMRAGWEGACVTTLLEMPFGAQR